MPTGDEQAEEGKRRDLVLGLGQERCQGVGLLANEVCIRVERMERKGRTI